MTSEKTNNQKAITIITPDENFIFLPLIPNSLASRWHSGQRLLDPIRVNIQRFCEERNIRLIKGKVKAIHKAEKALTTETNAKEYYDKLYLGIGVEENQMSQHISPHSFWEEKLNKMFIQYSKEKNSFFWLKSCNIAEFEIAATLTEISSKHRINIKIMQSTKNPRRFNKNQTLSKFKSIKKRCEDLECNVIYWDNGADKDANKSIILHPVKFSGKKDNCNNSKANSLKQLHEQEIYPIGNCLGHYIGIQGSAQFSSFSSKIHYSMHSDSSGDQITKAIKKYRERGKMFTDGNNGYIFIAVSKHNYIELKGKTAGLIRYLFYFFQKTLFYSEEKPANLIIKAYKMYLSLWRTRYISKSKA